jgi:hypothetical protein
MAKTSFSRPGAPAPAAQPVPVPKPPTLRPVAPPSRPAVPATAHHAPSKPAGASSKPQIVTQAPTRVVTVTAPTPPKLAPVPAKPMPAAVAKPAPRLVPPRKPVAPPVAEVEIEEPVAEVETELALEGTSAEETSVVEEQNELALEEREADVPAGALVQTNLLSGDVGHSQGEIEASDLDLPKLSLVHPTSDDLLEMGYAPGQYILANEVILWQPPEIDGNEYPPVELTVLRHAKQFVENLRFGESEEFPRIFTTKDEVLSNGGTLSFEKGEGNFVPQSVAIVLIKDPGTGHSAFSYEYGDAAYGLGLWRISGMAYKYAAKKIFTEERVRLRAGLHTGSFLLSSRKEKGRTNSYWVPVLRNGAQHDADFVDFAASCVA